MFDIGFSELLLIFVIGLIVLGPQKLPIAIRTVVSWIRALRNMATNVQNELAQELKLQELQDSIKKAEALNVTKFAPELAKTVEDLKASAAKMQSELHQQGKALTTQLEPNNATPTQTSAERPQADTQAENAEEDDSQLTFETATESQLDLSSYDPLADPAGESPVSETVSLKLEQASSQANNLSSNSTNNKQQSTHQQSSSS
ncbi:twin-arginine translocase subunit TatB [Mergibacter septicus]|uniref:Sec-independent protein translocase protein TatB n=1 Tax=Mergibacter septicus TaxID=221402 RepID=A0A8D4LNX2_9PAST|nr:Sec-independent protein translocase protein TatB [Mergibacter septicus]AWX15501.1 twin-arginine translocase subunit TatB [Mergibacter septicus]QDJ14755.1 twin-arginine translocase subunit TatB [Mergibacter septicus]UTU47816.1 Sec-independent protein translocase subunit TatB [Mergibacter septicus]WMR96576.1 Sec-independent protein translocase protein TatB [Mergibacter septicus]